ncbi:DUF305 domain-containing protein [Egicoccus halophilus]|uniref:Lipoprotein n=1 Tax=Egicoccus halophilus TaxID=1670830 RepID=A0A8J3EUW8_9ACTN|nr:DUF305 domain-containing protein [Egicoccus halophilus]GGI06843.1 lipoprotein [Egicoccus halophilus]
MKRVSLISMAVVVGVVAAGCTGGTAEEEPAAASSEPRIIQPGAPGEPSRELTPEEAAEAVEPPSATDADVAFMQGMIPHHAQALRMTRLVEDRTEREDLPLFAERMDISQEDEIDLMRRWLEERDEEVPSLLAEHEGHEGELMPGMLTEEEFAELEAAEGETFDRLFLESMMRHHAGALQMVEELFAAEGGQEPEISQFAMHIVSDQEIEMSRMQQMLADLDG